MCRTERKNSRDKSWYELSKDPSRESLRWNELLEQVSDRAQGSDCIHLMDREGDNYDLLALMLRRKDRFVVRACHDRALVADGRLLERLGKLQPSGFRKIEISERIADDKREAKHPPRRRRMARVAVAGCSVAIKQSGGAYASEEQLTLNVVRVWEPSPPTGGPAVVGGHLKRNGPPGWLPLGRGFESLHLIELVWRAAMAYRSSDQ